MTMRTPKSVLVTGGCGFIGSNFINQIYIRWPDAKIVNLDKLLPGSNACNVDCDLRNNAERYRLVVGDCCNRELTMKLLQDHQIDTIVHFAANSSVDDCYRDSVGAARNNVLAMTHFLEVCRLYDRLELFMHISTDEVYGDSGKDSQPKMEQSLLTPTNPYAATKASCEAMLNAYRVSYKLPTITARMNNVYGPRQCNAKVVPRFVLQAFEGEYFRRYFAASSRACLQGPVSRNAGKAQGVPGVRVPGTRVSRNIFALGTASPGGLGKAGRYHCSELW
uniref:dTDP-D-glucose 4,6-dehydratase n=1 Tax=Plectus sambesii TaxID=2011161 RepID=A0A914UXW6_9BILA